MEILLAIIWFAAIPLVVVGGIFACIVGGAATLIKLGDALAFVGRHIPGKKRFQGCEALYLGRRGSGRKSTRLAV